MLSKKRKDSKELFKEVLSNSKSFYGTNMSLRVFIGDSVENTRFSFVVSKKVSTKANKRNLLKRRGFSVIKNTLKNIKKGFTCVFFFKKNAITVSYTELNKEILFLLRKSKILK
ncbi:MAG TPA: ribonuclease P protein component [Ignavibacteria bacterium]|nr:ribonuclease P protein component [Ignavibacteria bacterium]